MYMQLLDYCDDLVSASSIARWENIGQSYNGFSMDIIVVGTEKSETIN